MNPAGKASAAIVLSIIIHATAQAGAPGEGSMDRAGDTAGAVVAPDPVQWAAEPHARVSSAVVMAAHPVGREGEAEYRFECTAGGGHSSDWQAGTAYTDKGLEPLTKYTYVAHARHARTKKPVAEASRPVAASTRAAAKGQGVESTHVAAIDKAIASGRLEVIPLMETGDKDNRINIVVINRWEKGQREAYNTPLRRDEFLRDAKHILEAFARGGEEAQPPYPTYRGFFNLYAVWWPDIPPWDPKDREKGFHWADYNEIRSRLFLPWCREGRGWVTHLAMFNGTGGGGGAGLREDERVGDAMIVGNKVSSFIHEFNHTAPGIPDEYTSSGMWGRGGEGSTTTSDYRRDHVKWRAWIEPGTPVPTPYAKAWLDKVGVVEGGVHRMAHLFRPTVRGCIMGSGSFAGDPKGMCAICQQRAVQRLYRWVDAIDETTPARKHIVLPGPATLRFAARRVAPDPDTHKTEWRLNGRVVAIGKDSVELSFGAVDEYELVFSLTDKTPFVRHDPPFARYPQAEARWRITNLKPTSDARPLRVRLETRAPAFVGEDNGSIEVNVDRGTPPYAFVWSDGETTPYRRLLPPGTYTVTVVDGEFRKETVTTTLKSGGFVPMLRAERRGGNWRVSVDGADGADLSFRWSDGSTGRTLTAAADGLYDCTITHEDGSRVVRQIRLKAPTQSLDVDVKRVVPSSGGANNGCVALEPSRGRPPYRFEWSDGVETEEAERHFLAPGAYTVHVWDANRCRVTRNVVVGSEPGFTLSGLRFERAGPGTLRIANPDGALSYLWFAQDHPAWLPRFPHGIYAGTFTAADGQTCEAEAFVIQNKGGLFVDERKDKNDFGHWVHLMAYTRGRQEEPAVVQVNTRHKGASGEELEVAGHKHGETTWDGKAADGRLHLEGKGPEGGVFDLLFISHPKEADAPLHVGTEFEPPKAGNYYVAAHKADTGAASRNRVGVAVTMGRAFGTRTPRAPDKARSARVLLWLDASDMDGDGQEDAAPPRRGAVMGWQGKAGGADFRDFVFFQPNQQNGKGVASWETIWIQNLSEAVRGCRTLMMVRREHDLSSVGTAPWRELNDWIGVGEFGRRLLSEKAAERMQAGALYVNGAKADPAKAPMPKGFYLVTYEFAEKMVGGFRTTEGHWEGAIAECIAFDGKLSEPERRGIEEYLLRKWLSAVHLERASHSGRR